jgi:hypothetical protein
MVVPFVRGCVYGRWNSDGRHAGGCAYGYRPVPGKPGELEIDLDEAAIIREIFESYVDGRTPRSA